MRKKIYCMSCAGANNMVLATDELSFFYNGKTNKERLCQPHFDKRVGMLAGKGFSLTTHPVEQPVKMLWES